MFWNRFENTRCSFEKSALTKTAAPGQPGAAAAFFTGVQAVVVAVSPLETVMVAISVSTAPALFEKRQ